MSTLQSSHYEAGEEYPPLLPVSGPAKARALAVAATGPIFIGYAAIAATLALVTAVSTGSTFSTLGILVAAGPGWLAAWHVPVDIAGQELSVLPLLPTVLLMLLAARAATNAANRLDAATPPEALPILSVIGGTHAVVGLAIAVLDTSPTLTTSPALAFFLCGLLATAAATIGLANRCGLTDAIRARATPAVIPGLRAALAAGAALTAASALVLASALIGSWTTTVHAFHTEAPGFGNSLGMLLLCLAYLPNVLIGTCAFATGPGATIGHAAITPLTFHPAPTPPLPILAIIPNHPAHWWPLLFILPPAVGALTAWQTHRHTNHTNQANHTNQVDQVDEAPATRGTQLRTVLIAALAVSVAAIPLAALSGGQLANGPFNPVTIPAGLFAAVLFVGLTVGGSLTSYLLTQPTKQTELWPAPEETDPEPDPDDPSPTDSPATPEEDTWDIHQEWPDTEENWPDPEDELWPEPTEDQPPTDPQTPEPNQDNPEPPQPT